jgi:2-polyprenyl-6-methoxyphenol hydroxylase-like FAD-dependent oxidoreductase
MKTQVTIVGAGPVGLTMAAELARYGVSVRIVDKAAQRTDKSKAVVLWSRTLELLDRAGCADAFADAGNQIEAANIVADGRVIGHINISEVDSSYPFALALPQSETERLLEECLGRLGVSVERKKEISSFRQNENSVTAILRNPVGKEEVIEADWLIGCDGAHSAVRHGLGFSFLGDTLQSEYILADLDIAGYPLPTTEMATYWHEDGVLLIIPLSPTRFRVIADLGPSNGSSPVTPTLDQVQAIMDRRGPGGMSASDPIWLSGFRINERKIGNYRSGRVFVAGDAAHVHSPAGGQGMNTGMQDAFNLAWKLALVCRGEATGTLLDSYCVERSAIADQVIEAAGRLTKVASLRNRTAQTVRNLFGWLLLGLAPVRKAIVDAMTEISIGYDHSPLNGSASHRVPAPGQRLAPVSGQTPAGAGDRPRFALFASPSSRTRLLTERFPSLIDAFVRPPVDRDMIALVRPDGYIACVVKVDEAEAIGDYLHAISFGLKIAA